MCNFAKLISLWKCRLLAKLDYCVCLPTLRYIMLSLVTFWQMAVCAMVILGHKTSTDDGLVNCMMGSGVLSFWLKDNCCTLRSEEIF